MRKDDQPKVPRSLFDRGSFASLRRDNKPLKIKPGYARPFHKVISNSFSLQNLLMYIHTCNGTLCAF